MSSNRLLIDEELIEDGRAVVLGISGGPDSVCLLFELLALGEARRRAGGSVFPVVCAHVNHGLRGDESDADEAWVAALCGRLGVPLEILRIDAAALAKERGLTVEEAGRDARYAFFDEVCAKYGDDPDAIMPSPASDEVCAKYGDDPDAIIPSTAQRISVIVAKNCGKPRKYRQNGNKTRKTGGNRLKNRRLPKKIATNRLFSMQADLPHKFPQAEPQETGTALTPVIAVAHNLEDQSETVLMRILRGTGTDGLAGMPKRRKSAEGYDIVRPLLGASRGEIAARLAEYGEEARTDGSNSDTGYFRNKLRLEVFPYLEDGPGVDLRQGLLRLAENAAEDKDFFDRVVTGALDEYLEYPPAAPETATMPAEILAGSHPAIRRRLIRAAFAELGLRKDIAAVHLAAAERLLRTFEEGGEASGKRVEFPQDYTFGITGKNAVFRAPGVVEPGWKPRRKL